MRYVVAGLALVVAMFFVSGGVQAEKKPKHTIKEVMKKVMKGGLLKKVAKGQADEDDKKLLVIYLTSLSENEPPKGSKADWKKRTGALVIAAKKAAKGDKKAAKSLGKLANCGACHKLHK